MNFDKASTRKSNNNRAGSVTRQDLLAKVNSDRAVREASRRRLKAATCIQKVFKGWSARASTKCNCIDQWLHNYSNAAADITHFVPVLEISGSMLPLITQACKQLSASSDSRISQPESSFLCGSAAVALRGSLAIVLRSIGSAKHELNFCGLAVDVDHRSQWLRQSCQLIRLCSAVLQQPFVESQQQGPLASSMGSCKSSLVASSVQVSPSKSESTQAHQLLQTASARLLMVLTDDKLWKCFQPGSEDASEACQRLLTAVSNTSAMPLALQSLVSNPPASQAQLAATSPATTSPAATSPATTSPAATSPATTSPATTSPAATSSVTNPVTSPAATSPDTTSPATTSHPATTSVDPQRPQLPALPLSTERQQKHAMIIQMTLHAALRPLTAHVPASSASTSGRTSPSSSSPTAQAGAAQLACHVITAPQLLSQLPATARKQLTDAAVLSTLMAALQRLASRRQQTDATAAASRESGTKAEGVGRDQSVSLCTGPRRGACALVGVQLGGREAALTALGNLAGMLRGERVLKPTQGNKLLHYLPKSKLLEVPGMAQQFLATASCLLQCAFSNHWHAAPAAEQKGLLDGFWPLAEGTFITQLLDNSGSPATAVAEVASFYHLLLEGLAQLGSGAAQQGSSIVNALSFGCSIQQSLWRWCAMTMGLPLEAPREATRGWDVATLRAGMQGLNPDHAPRLGLFCRLYAHTLLVLDDNDFYDGQDVFSLAQQRGIATALNALVFRSFCPASSAASSQSKVTPRGPSSRMLATWAPVLLRAMYERNVRRPYCPASLWLEPYHATCSSGDQGTFSAEAIVRALLQAQSPNSIHVSRGHLGWPAVQAGLLGTAPQCIPFEQRLLVFRALVAEDKERGHWDKPYSEGGPAPVKFTIHRGSLLQHGWVAFQNLGAAVKGRLVVSFVNEQGMLEAGLDYGGLVKEFLEQVISTGFNADYGLFTATADGLAYPQPAATTVPNGLGLLEFLGLVVGKALYEGILLDVPLAPFFVARLQGRRPMFDDLAALDAELYRSLSQLKRSCSNHKAPAQCRQDKYDGDATDLCLDFSVEDDTFGVRSVHSLIPGGSQVAVTDSNKLHYIHLAADWHLNGRLGASSAAFARGIAQVIPPGWLKLFNTQEVNQLLGGGESGVLDVADMAAHAHYSGGYSKDHATVKLFWKVMSSLSDKERQAVVRFVTSSSRAPLGGFQHLNPPLTVHKVPCEASLLAAVGGKDVDRLPSASTCYNMLKLPNYRRASTLKEKLLYAVTSNAGFELS